MRTKKKNRFLTFCFSMLPGAGEMYMGFMKTGVSLMLLFFLVVMFSVWINQGIISALAIVVWFYGFFHANHLAGLGDEDFVQVKDEFLLGLDGLVGTKDFVRKYNKVVACGLIFAGICLLWNTLTDVIDYILPNTYNFIINMMWRIGDFVPSVVIGIAIVVFGIKLLGGKKADVADKQEEQDGKADN